MPHLHRTALFSRSRLASRLRREAEVWLTRSLVLILELAERDWHGVRHEDRQEGQAAEEFPMNDASFLSQLEQRTQQVKITLANLEAERVRIEGLISRLQPLVPHYDALIAAERAIDESRIELDALAGMRSDESSSSAPEHMRTEYGEQGAGEHSESYGE